MPDDLEQLQRKIEEGLEAVRELRRLDAEKKKRERPKLKLIKGGLIGAGIWAGVEWLRDYRRTVGTLAFSGLAVTGTVVAELPHSPGSDPPGVIKPPASTRPSVRPTVPVRLDATPTPPRPPRTSPLRTPPVSATVAAPAATQPAKAPTPAPSRTPAKKPTEAILPTPTLLPSTTLTPPAVVSPEACTVDLLGVKLCLPLG